VAPMCPPMWANWRHLTNTIEPSVCGGDAAVLRQITLTICFANVLSYVKVVDNGYCCLCRPVYATRHLR